VKKRFKNWAGNYWVRSCSEGCDWCVNCQEERALYACYSTAKKKKKKKLATIVLMESITVLYTVIQFQRKLFSCSRNSLLYDTWSFNISRKPAKLFVQDPR